MRGHCPRSSSFHAKRATPSKPALTAKIHSIHRRDVLTRRPAGLRLVQRLLISSISRELRPPARLELISLRSSSKLTAQS